MYIYIYIYCDVYAQYYIDWYMDDVAFSWWFERWWWMCIKWVVWFLEYWEGKWNAKGNLQCSLTLHCIMNIFMPVKVAPSICFVYDKGPSGFMYSATLGIHNIWYFTALCATWESLIGYIWFEYATHEHISIHIRTRLSPLSSFGDEV